MKLISVRHQDGVAVVQLDKGVTNAIGLEMVNDLSEALSLIEQEAHASSLVLCSANDKFFSIGLDMPTLFNLSRADFEFFYRAFNHVCMQLYTFPKATVAAIAGHAIAGGCILALCCDYRFIAQGKKLMGLNEIKLGVPVPYLADRVLQDLVGTRTTRDILSSGDFYPPEKAFRMGLVDEVLPLKEVLSKSIQKAKELGLQSGAYAITKDNRVGIVSSQVRLRLEEKMKAFIDCWYAPETRDLLRSAMEKF